MDRLKALAPAVCTPKVHWCARCDAIDSGRGAMSLFIGGAGAAVSCTPCGDTSKAGAAGAELTAWPTAERGKPCSCKGGTAAAGPHVTRATPGGVNALGDK